MAVKQVEAASARRLGRRAFLGMLGAGAAGLALRATPAGAATYAVGAGKGTDPYATTVRAIQVSGGWPPANIAGRTVIIKPNLVGGAPAASGITTDPQVVRAIVDLALAAGAASIKIVEGVTQGNVFAACGYALFASYDPQGRVTLVDLNSQPSTLVRVPRALAYTQVYMPNLLLAANVFLVSAGKLKTHSETMAPLSTKNLFGLPPSSRYQTSANPARFNMHDRGVNQAVVDMNLVHPPDFAVVDGIWGMEGNGPMGGTRIEMDAVLAGANALAVDTACLGIMGLTVSQVQHLQYASLSGLGPATTDTVQVLGDRITPHAFVRPTIPPVVWRPACAPGTFSPARGQTTRISYSVSRACQARLEVVVLSDSAPTVTPVRLLNDFVSIAAGAQTATWDGRNDAGQVVAPGFYTVRVRATAGDAARDAYATGWAIVTA